MRIVPFRRISAQDARVVDQVAEEAPRRGEPPFAGCPAIGVAQQPRDIRLVDGVDRLRPDQLFEDGQVVAIGLDGVDRPAVLLQLAAVPGPRQLQAAVRGQGRQTAEHGREGAGGSGGEERELVGRRGGIPLLLGQERRVVRIGAGALLGGKAVDRRPPRMRRRRRLWRCGARPTRHDSTPSARSDSSPEPRSVRNGCQERPFADASQK